MEPVLFVPKAPLGFADEFQRGRHVGETFLGVVVAIDTIALVGGDEQGDLPLARQVDCPGRMDGAIDLA